MARCSNSVNASPTSGRARRSPFLVCGRPTSLLPTEINLSPAQRHDFPLARPSGKAQHYGEIEVRVRFARIQKPLCVRRPTETARGLGSPLAS